MNKFILFSNIKGGVGKTTLCAHFTEYKVKAVVQKLKQVDGT